MSKITLEDVMHWVQKDELKVRQSLARLIEILAHKGPIQKAEENYRKADKDSANAAHDVRKFALREAMYYQGITPAFHLHTGVCDAAYFYDCQSTIRYYLAQTFNEINDLNNPKVYPIDGQEQFFKDHFAKTYWSNENRWAYVEHCVIHLQKLLGELK